MHYCISFGNRYTFLANPGEVVLEYVSSFYICRYLWRVKHTFAIAQHKHHHSIYEEADANKRRKRYARPLIDLHMKIYKYEGMQSWTPEKGNPSGKK